MAALLYPPAGKAHTAMEIFNAGKVKYNAREYPAAIDAFTRALAAKANFPEAYYYRGLSRFVQKDTAAYLDFSQAIALKPGYAKAYMYRGLVRFRGKAYTEAIADFDKAIEQKPDLEDAYFYRGGCQMELKNYEAAEKDLGKALELRPAFAGAFYTRGLTEYMQGKFEPAERDFSRTIALDSLYSVKLFFFRGMTRISLHQREAACQDLKKALEAGYADAREMILQYCR